RLRRGAQAERRPLRALRGRRPVPDPGGGAAAGRTGSRSRGAPGAGLWPRGGAGDASGPAAADRAAARGPASASCGTQPPGCGAASRAARAAPGESQCDVGSQRRGTLQGEPAAPKPGTGSRAASRGPP
ncbi:unnamed protein product, partial [Effrenium voratum]